MKAKVLELYDAEKLQELFTASNYEPVIFFKHSITCPISKNAFKEISKIDATIWVMVTQDAKKASQEFVKMTGIKHESPQTVIIKDGKPVFQGAHYDATVETVESVLAEFSLKAELV